MTIPVAIFPTVAEVNTSRLLYASHSAMGRAERMR